MKEHFKKSIKKFKEDWFAKVIYDIIKYLLITFGFVAILKFIPLVKNIMTYRVSISVWLFLIFSISIVLITLICLSLRFRSILISQNEKNQIDDLTGLKNYKALNNIDDIFKRNISQEKHPISLILFDIDNFKFFNDTYGHNLADKILSKLGELLKKDSRAGKTTLN